jgi:hypothetical protein
MSSCGDSACIWRSCSMQHGGFKNRLPFETYAP